MAANSKNTNQSKIEKMANNAIYLATSANDYVLNTTEQAFDASFRLADKSLDITYKVLKRGLEFKATQQEFAFGVLNGVKKKVFKN